MVKNKQKRAKHLSVDEDFDRIFKRFNTYEERIDRLKELERQLNALDIRGFETEASLIRTKIKDPVAVYEVEKKINSLKNKIEDKINSRDKLEKIKKINPKISALIDTKYHNFISSVKQKLSEDELKNEKTFRRKLDQEFRERINLKIEDLKKHKSGIYNKLSSQFNIKNFKKEKELQKKVYQEFLLDIREYEKAHRMKVSADYNSRLSREINEEKENLKKRYNEKVNELRKRINLNSKEYEDKQKRLFEDSQKSRMLLLSNIGKKKSSLDRRKEFLRRKALELRRNIKLSNKEMREIRENLENETKQIHLTENKLEKKKVDLEDKLSKKKRELFMKIQKQRDKLQNNFDRLVRTEEAKLEKEKNKFKSIVETNYAQKFKNAIENEKKILRYKVRKNLSKKMDEYINSLLK